jgi:enoyl-CoA hydratase/carnithine racemase
MKPLISAKEAFENKIADKVIPFKDLEKVIVEISQQFKNINKKTLSGTKKLTNYSLNDLKAYLKFETEEIVKIGQQENFGDQ